MSCRGKVKSFVPASGYGFIECPEAYAYYQTDIMLFQTEIPPGTLPKRGDKVQFDIREDSNGPVAKNVNFFEGELDTSTTKANLGYVMGKAMMGAYTGQGTNMVPKPKIGHLPYAGEVKFFDFAKGWGVISCNTTEQMYGKDVFFGKQVCTQPVHKGMKIRFSVKMEDRGPAAIEVTPVDGLQLCSTGERKPVPYWQASVPQTIPVEPAYGPAYGGKGGYGDYGGYGGYGDYGAYGGYGYYGDYGGYGCYGGYDDYGKGFGKGMGKAGGDSMSMGDRSFFGVVKSFSVEKGWGHITCGCVRDLFGQDVMMFGKQLEIVDLSNISPGSLVRFKLSVDSKGPKASDVRFLPEGTFGVDDKDGNEYVGTVKSYNAEKGWGFLTSDTLMEVFGEEIFIHQKMLNGQTPSAGEQASCTVVIGKKGKPEAKNLVMRSGS